MPVDMGNLHIDLGSEYRLFSSPGRLSGVMCLPCTEREQSGAFFATNSLGAVLRWIYAHDARRHDGARLTPEARSMAGLHRRGRGR